MKLIMVSLLQLSSKHFKLLSQRLRLIFVLFSDAFRLNDLLLDFLDLFRELSLNVLEILLHCPQVHFQVIFLFLLVLVN